MTDPNPLEQAARLLGSIRFEATSHWRDRRIGGLERALREIAALPPAHADRAMGKVQWALDRAGIDDPADFNVGGSTRRRPRERRLLPSEAYCDTGWRKTAKR